MTEQEFQPESGIHQTVEVPGVRARWTIQHSYSHTCPQGHTHSGVRADMEPLLTGNSESAWRAAVQPLVLAALLRSFALPPRLENRRKRSWALQLPSTPASPGAQPPGTCSTQNPDRRRSRSGRGLHVPACRGAARPTLRGLPAAARGAQAQRPVCRLLRREEVLSKPRPRPRRS